MSRRKRRKRNGEDHHDESWLLPYADLLTLLLALFIVLFASSSVDAQRFKALSSAFNNVFSGGTGYFDYPSPIIPEGELQSSDIQRKDPAVADIENIKDKENKQKAEQYLDKEELANLQNKVNAYIVKGDLAGKLETSLTDDGLYVSIRDNVLFASGSAIVREKDLKIANEIAGLLVMEPPRNIIISGHTDNVPIGSAPYDSNWELSVMRAVNFMKIILQNEKLDPRLFSAKGYGELQPVASNATKKGRAKNRRVEILIMPRTKS